MSLAYTYEFTLERGNDKRTFKLRIHDRREFLIRELRKLPSRLGWKAVDCEAPDVIVEEDGASARLRPELRKWLLTFLTESEVEDLFRSIKEARPPNCS